MTRWDNFTGIAAPLPRDDINTDDIFPGPQASPVLRRPGGTPIGLDRSKMGANAFAALRFNDDGTPNPQFVLNQPPYDRAQILVTGANFGCGSSREMAVWALAGIGIRAILAPSFGDIFYGNCFRSGLLPARLTPSDTAEVLHVALDHTSPLLSIDLVERVVVGPDQQQWDFQVGDYHRQLLLAGVDEIDATLRRMGAVEAHEAAYLERRPWLVPTS